MVRVTNPMMVRRYMGNLNTSLGMLSESTAKISSGKKYARLSENPLEVSRALRLEEDLVKNEQNVKTLEEAQSELAAAESNLVSIIDVLSTCYERSLKASTGTSSHYDRNIIADELDAYMDYIIKSMNSSFNDKYLFSNTNNSDSAPFELTDDGKVLFNGADVNEIFKGEDGNYYVPNKDDDGNVAYTDSVSGDTYYKVGNNYYTDPNDDTTIFTGDVSDLEQQNVLVSESFVRYADVGLGMSFDSDGNVIPSSVIEISFGGLDALGFGMTDDGLPKNCLSVLVEMSNQLRSTEFDLEDFEDIGNQLITVKDTTNFYVAKVGSRSNYIEKSINRLGDEEYNLESLKKLIVEIDTSEEIINMKQYEFAWNAILQMGNKLIPPTLMDYVN